MWCVNTVGKFPTIHAMFLLAFVRCLHSKSIDIEIHSISRPSFVFFTLSVSNIHIQMSTIDQPPDAHEAAHTKNEITHVHMDYLGRCFLCNSKRPKAKEKVLIKKRVHKTINRICNTAVVKFSISWHQSIVVNGRHVVCSLVPTLIIICHSFFYENRNNWWCVLSYFIFTRLLINVDRMIWLEAQLRKQYTIYDLKCVWYVCRSQDIC
jgi:hypothetical protein